MNALQKRLAEQKNPCAVIIEENPEVTETIPSDDPFTVLQKDYRNIRASVDLYGEAIAGRKYVAALERKVTELEARLRVSRSSGW